MATKKDIADIKSSISQINIAISDIRESVITALLNENKQLKYQVKKLEVELSDNLQYQRCAQIL